MGSLPKELSSRTTSEDLHLDVPSSSSSEEDEEEEKSSNIKKKNMIASTSSGKGNTTSSSFVVLQNKRRRSRGGFHSHLSLGDLVGDQKKFWASLQHTHDWSRRLNDQKDNELEWDYGDVQTPLNLNSSNWTFNDFMERYNQLYASLNQIQDMVFSSTATSTSSSADSKILNEALVTHLEGIREEYERFLKRSSLMAEEFTDLWDEVMCRVELLAAKWEILMARSSASKHSVEESNPDHFHSDIEQDVRGLRKWLKEMEGKILPLRFRTKWSREAIEEKMKEIQVILNDIESHGRIVKSVLRLCEDLKKGEGELSPRQQCLAQSKASYYDVDRAYRIAKGLEDRWHGVWLRSLEWHYFLEKLAWNSSESFGSAFDTDQKEIKHSSAPASLLGPISPNCGFDSEDEPRCKVPKLTGLQDLSSSPSSTLLRTKRRKTSEYARINKKDDQNEEAESGKLSPQEEKKDEGQCQESDNEKPLVKSWNRVLEAAAALEEIHCKSQEQRKTLKVHRKKLFNNNTMNGGGDILCDDNRHLSSPNNNSVSSTTSKISLVNLNVDNELLRAEQQEHNSSNLTEKNEITTIDEICKMATSESEQSLSSVSSSGNNNDTSDQLNANKLTNGSSTNVMLASRKTIPNCATYFFQHVSEDEHGNHSAEKGSLKSPRYIVSSRAIHKKDPYERPYPEEDEDDTDDHYLLSDSASTSDFLGSNAWIKELEEDDDNNLTDFSDINAMESSTNTIVESSSSTFLNEDIQELVHQAEKLVQTDKEKPKKRAPLSFANSNYANINNSRRRRSRKSLVLHQVTALDGCEASAEATSTSESDFSEDNELDNEGCSSPGEMDTSISSHDQTLTGSCSTNALDVVSGHASSIALGCTGAMSRLKKNRKKSSILSASESHLVYSFKKSVSLNNSQKSRSVASIYGSSGSFGGVVKKRKGSGSSPRKFAIPCMSISSEEEIMDRESKEDSRRKSLEGVDGEKKQQFLNKSGDDCKKDEQQPLVEGAKTENMDSVSKNQNNSKITESPRSVESEEDFWDQENYLSEHNYDEAIDEDTTYRVLNFGDDYSIYINSISDGISSSNYHPPKQQRRKTRRNPWRDDRKDSMSESEVEDVKRVLNTSKEKYEDTVSQFNIYLETPPENVLQEDYFNLKKTCQENMSCLALLMEPIFNESDSATLKKKGRELKGLLQKWDGLLRSIIRRIDLAKVFHDLESDIHQLEKGLEDYLGRSNEHETIQCSNDLKERITSYKDSIVSLNGYKADLFKVNLGVHNFLAELVCSSKNESPSSSASVVNLNGNTKAVSLKEQPQQKLLLSSSLERDSSLHTKRESNEAKLADRLKERIVKLYAKWEEVFHIMNARVAECENTLSKLMELEEESKKLLFSNVKHIRRKSSYLLNEEDEDSGISGSSTETEIAHKERLLERLRLLARELEQTLSPESTILKEISQNLESTSNELKSLSHYENSPVRKRGGGIGAATSRGAMDAEDHVFHEGVEENPFRQHGDEDGDYDWGMETLSLSSPGLERHHHRSASKLRSRINHRHCDSTGTGSATSHSLNNNSSRGGSSNKNSGRKRSWKSRVLRTAVPMQIGLFLMWFLTWIMEPTCCDSSNTFFLAPQLRYVNGPPPI
ncbi:uncharacterized protein klar isoform X2 [Lepeophtheirus salmonis]|uniref:uncharacterized protein klar isoform X2 n=1 Tax=Lepeophtheirus salmonis TaxID=72036 RepID=UPI001AE8DE97|nr:uncharacterized protein LOC121129291 isoform X2 [Lepeophtheirus salmonis]